MDLLPYQIVQRKKAKFWEGAGVEEQLAAYADAQVTEDDFQCERDLPDGSRLNTKEELFYYRIFVEQFGRMEDLNWMGRTSGSTRSGVDQCSTFWNGTETGAFGG